MGNNNQLDPAIAWARNEYLGLGLYGNNKSLVLSELRRVLVDKIEQMISKKGLSAPFQPEQIASERRICKILEVEFSENTLSDALLVPCLAGFNIKIRSGIHQFRKRFACAHEIAHTYFFNINVSPPRREYQLDKSAYWIEEGLSCELARIILLPSFSLLDTITTNNLRPSISGLKYLSSLYQVSHDVIRLRIISDLRLWDCVFFRSQLLGETLATKRCDISKGHSFRKFVIPLSISNGSDYSKLLEVCEKAQKNGYSKQDITLLGRKYTLEVLRSEKNHLEFISILTGAPSVC